MSLYNYDDNLVAGWRFDSVDPVDVVSGNYNATSVNIDSTNLVQGPSRGEWGLSLNGTDEYLSIGPSNALITGTSFSVALTFSKTALQSTEYLLAIKYAAGSSFFSIRTSTSLVEELHYIYRASASVPTPSGITPIKLNQVYTIIVSVDGANLEAYVNGISEGLNVTDRDPTKLPSSDNALIGDLNGADQFQGIYYSAAIYNTALTEMQAKHLTARIKSGQFLK